MHFSHTETLHLLDLAVSGDQAALDKLLKRHRNQVLRIVRARLGPQLRQFVESQDIVQEAMLQAVQSIDTLQSTDDAALLKWLAGIVENELRNKSDYHGASKRTSTFVPLEPDLVLNSAAPDLEPPEASITNEQQELVDFALNDLPKQMREVFILRHFVGLSFVRIAESMPDTNPNQIRMMYRRARKQLVEALDGRL